MADILITHAENFSPEARKVLEGAGHHVFACPGSWPVCDFAYYGVVWIRLEPFGMKEREKFPIMHTLCCNATGLDHIDKDAMHGVRILSLQDCREQMDSVHSTAELTIALMLALLRNLPAAVESTKRGEWDRWQFVGRELRGKEIQLYGMGRIGRQVSVLANAFGANVNAFDPKNFSLPAAAVECKLDTIWTRTADIVVCCASLNETSRNLFNAERFAQMKPGALFINTARGAIVDEAALLAALESGHLGGAALDVVQNEPNVNPKLVEFARREPGRLILTPHVGGCTREGLHRTEEILAAKLVEVLG